MVVLRTFSELPYDPEQETENQNQTDIWLSSPSAHQQRVDEQNVLWTHVAMFSILAPTVWTLLDKLSEISQSPM